ncbi:MAG: metalloregulator ArsR/SmtB family transcription factor [Cyclobacteriaceae bacterium]|jgi:ArsR family transcriptional regulator
MRLKNFSLVFGVQLFKALSEEPRVRILNLMFMKGEMCITDLEIILEFTQAKTSRHLSYLKNSGIVNSRKADQWVFYSIKEEVTDLIKLIFDYFDKDHILKKDLENFEILLNQDELAKFHQKEKSYLE